MEMEMEMEMEMDMEMEQVDSRTTSEKILDFLTSKLFIGFVVCLLFILLVIYMASYECEESNRTSLSIPTQPTQQMQQIQQIQPIQNGGKRGWYNNNFELPHIVLGLNNNSTSFEF
jgi:hypothetical protein